MSAPQISKRKRQLISILSSIFFTSVYRISLMSQLEKLLEGKPAFVSLVLTNFIGLLVLAVVYFFLTAKTTNSFWGRLSYYSYAFIRSSIIFWKSLMGQEPYPRNLDRGKDEFKQDIIKNIQNSKKIYFLVLSAYTMFYDEREKFILEALENLDRKKLKEKDIKILLLNRESKQFESRGRWFVKKMRRDRAPYRVKDYKEYVLRCEDIEKELQDIVKPSTENAICYYDCSPIWRLHIFDDMVYVSIYKDDVGGHLTSLFRFEKEAHDTIYLGLSKYFNYLYSSPT